MKKSNDFDEIIKRLKEAVESIKGDTCGPIFVDVSINVCPNIEFIPEVKERKVPVDILETEKNIHAVIGLPDMGEENIELSCNGRTLELTACNERETLRETIELPARVNKTGIKTTYENGILEVVFNKSRKKKDNA